MDYLKQYLQSMNEDFESNFEGDFDLSPETMRVVKTLPATEQKKIIKANAVAAARISGNSGMGAGVLTKGISGAAPSSVVDALVASSVGDLNLTVKRVGVNIDFPLPYIIFGANDRTADYASTLPNLMGPLLAFSPTVTVEVTKTTAGGITFEYTLGENSDTVTVTALGNINYQAFLASQQNNFFKTRYMLVSISDENYNTQQFAQPILYGNLSALGKNDSNQLILRSRTNSWMFRRDRVEVVMQEQSVVPDFSIASSMIAVNNLEVGYDIFMSFRVNNNKL